MSRIWGAFGSTIIGDVKEGDLLFWNEWQVIEKKLIKIVNYGVYIGQTSEFYGSRQILYAYLVCSKTGDKVKILAARLKKTETS